MTQEEAKYKLTHMEPLPLKAKVGYTFDGLANVWIMAIPMFLMTFATENLKVAVGLVGLIMILKCRPMDRKLYEQIREHQGELDMAYEMYMTFYEKSAYIDALAVCGNTVAAYSSDPKIHASYMEENCQKVVRKNGYKATVKIFTDLRPFLERLDSMNAHKDTLEEGIKFTPDEKYPELSRNELIRQTILALCL